MEIAEVTDRESLEAYLETLEGDGGVLTARRVAFCTAARVMPLTFQYFLSEDAARRDLPEVLSALAIGGVASTWPTPPVDPKAADTSAADAAFAATDASAAAFASAFAAKDASAAAFAAASACASASAAYAADVIWEVVRADLSRSAEYPQIELPRLWQNREEPEELRLAWEQAKRRMEADTAADWSFWILWYERVRAGRDFHADKLAEFLNPLREYDWKKGPAHINPLFDDLLALYLEEDELEALRAKARGLEAERPARKTIASIAQRSHNMPPELIDETQIVQTVELIWELVAETSAELEKPNPEKSRLRDLATSMLDGMRTIAGYVGNKCDLFLEEAMKSGGRWAGPVIFGALISPKLIDFVRGLLNYAGMP